MNALSAPVQILVNPVDAIPPAVSQRRWLVPLLLVVAMAAFSGVAIAERYDPTADTVQQLQMTGKLNNTTESELAESVQTAQRVQLLKGVCVAVFGLPVLALALAGLLKLVSWLLGLKARFMDLFTALCLALVPLAVFYLLLGLCALWQHQVTPSEAAKLLPTNLALAFKVSSPKLARVLGVVDFFQLWSAGLLGLGIAAAARIRRSRGLFLGFCAYAAYAAVVMLGLPGLGGGHP